MMDSHQEEENTIGGLIRAARKKMPMSQHQLATRIGKSKQLVSGAERNSPLPNLEVLLKLYQTLVPYDGSIQDTALTQWLFKWIEREVMQNQKIDHSVKEQVRTVLQKTWSQWSKQTIIKKPHLTWSLEDFPHAFTPLTIICGDRRETTPLTRGDIFAYSVAITDLMFLCKLGLDPSVTIRSDKLCVLTDREYLREELGKTNLLVIGSPAVNLATRVINNESVFRFALDLDAKQWEETLNSLKEIIDLNKGPVLREFWKQVQDANRIDSQSPTTESRNGLSSDELKNIEEAVRRITSWMPPKTLMNKFRKPGFVDPADGAVHATTTRQENDFAMVSLARNPYADPEKTDYVCIMVAGIHGPGTAHALKKLGERDFKDHPFGGVLEVELDVFGKGWPARFEQARCQWHTKPYKADTLIGNLDRALKQPKNRSAAFANLNDGEIEACLKFVRSIAGERGEETAKPRMESTKREESKTPKKRIETI